MPDIPNQPQAFTPQYISLSQAISFAQQAGFTGTGLAIIVAIAQAESGLNVNAYNPNDPYGGSFGVLQINGAHFVQGSGMTELCALNPGCAFSYAYDLSKNGTDFTPWGAYTNGSYSQYLNQSSSGIPITQGSGGTINTQNPTYPGTSNPVSSLSNPITSSGLWQYISDPTRLLKVTMGLLLIGLSLFLLIEPEATS